MEYHEAVNTLERLRRLRPKLGTDTTASLLEYLGDPHEGIPAVQIAGSNGKGSTARMLERVLREAGLDVGLYTSPDLNDLRERIRVGGTKVPKGEVVAFVEEIWPDVVDRSVEGDAPTFFEAFTALALWHFGRESVDVIVLEVGIGGRYDATSVVDPVASAVTSVSLEHTDLLGETVEEIARDKAHVAPEDAPLVTGATGAALETIRETNDVLTVGGGRGSSGDAEEDGATSDPDFDDRPDVLATEGEMVSATESALSLSGPDWSVETRTPLLGEHQAVNAGVAAALARQVGAATGTAVTETDIAAGIRNVRWPGRFEVMDDAPLVVLDGAHNPDACAKLASLLDRFEYDDLHLVFGAMRDKDHAAMCRSLPRADRVYLAEPAVGRAQGTDVLSAVFDRETRAKVHRSGTVLDALDDAIRIAGETDCVLVTGSLYTVGEARDRFTRTPTVVRTDTPLRARSVLRRADVPTSVRQERRDRVVDRTVRFHARRDEAAVLVETMLSLGGTGAVSGIKTADEHVEVVLDGSLEQFRRLVTLLHERGGGDGHIGTQLGDALGMAPVDSGADTGAPVDERPGDYPWTDGPAVMGVLDVTADSIDDDGERSRLDEAVARAREMVAEGAAVVDVVGASTVSSEASVPVDDERAHVVGVVERLGDLDVTVSVATGRPSVAEAALAAGVDAVTDRTALADARMRRVVAEWDVPVIVLHDRSAQADSDVNVEHDDAVGDALEEFGERILLAERGGIPRSRVVVGPELAFGTDSGGPQESLDRLSEFRGLGTSVVFGHAHEPPSSKGNADGHPEDRLARLVASTAIAVERGVDLIRARDVAETVAAVTTAEQAVRGGSNGTRRD